MDAEFIRWVEDKTVIGFWFVRVRATIWNTTWETSIFPTKEKEYLLAIKASVRKKENLHENMEESEIIELS